MKSKNLIVAIFSLLAQIGVSQAQTYPHKSTGTTGVGYLPKVAQVNLSGYDLLNNSLIYDNGANIGISTTNPTEKLEVSGNIKNSGRMIMGGNHFIYNCASAVINWGAGSGDLYFRSLQTQGNYSSGYNDLAIIKYDGKMGLGTTSPTSKLYIKGAGNSATTSSLNVTNIGSSSLLFVRDDGYIGLGTTSPSQKLEIYHNDATGGIALNRASGTSSKSEIKFSKTGTQLWSIGNDIDNNGGQTFYIWDQIRGFAPIYINQYGKVGIGGVIPPDNQYSIYKLYVKDGICTRDVKVTAGTFPDYVFEKDYSLMSIYALEKYINDFKHLPGIPSAQEIAQNDGYEIGDMQEKLVKIVEEQSLYIISLQKQIDALKSEITNIKK